MTAIVVPFRGPDAKRRLASIGEEERAELALAMLADELAARVLADPGAGQGAAVASALDDDDGLTLVVNADLPCATPDDLRRLEQAIPAGGLALVEAEDGTTNALGLSTPALF